MAQWLWRDRVLLGVVVVGALLFSYQLAVTILQPAWYAPVTYWLRFALSWLLLLLVVYVSSWLSRARRPEAAAWWMISVTLLSAAIGQTLWTLGDQFIFRHGVPFPGLPDLFFLLQYPLFLLAILLIPHTGLWGPRVIMLLDGVLVMGAATALSWHFLLAPLFSESGVSRLAKVVSLAYPAGDLVVLFGLTLLLLRPLRYSIDRPVVGLLVLAVACLIVRGSWAVGLILQRGYVYRSVGIPTLFRIAGIVLLALAALVQLRLVQHAALWHGDVAGSGPERQGYPRQDLRASLRLFLPIVAGLLASAAIAIHATLTEESAGWQHLIAPLAVGFCLLLLVILRQGVSFLELVRLRRELEVARARELAQGELTRRKDEFLSVVSHELRTPLVSLRGYTDLLLHRFNSWRPHEEDEAARLARSVAMARTALTHCDTSLQRLTRLADDLTDDARIRDGRLTFHLAPCDLGSIVRTAVEEQRVAAPDRTIHLYMPAAGDPIPVEADADRVGQVVTNYLTNALKYSTADAPIVVRVELGGDLGGELGGAWARVSVRDEGPGLLPSDQARVWERFSRVEGINVQHGSGVSLGIGLFISRTIIEGHHGHVGVRSTPGQGSTFWFTLPLAPAPI